jgi:hypothetical protein
VSEQQDDDAAQDPQIAQDPQPEPRPGAAEDVDVETGPAQLRLRRAPRYRRFGLTGVLAGVLTGVVLALSFTVASDYSIQTIAGYFAAILGLVGALLGLGLAVLIERRRS